MDYGLIFSNSLKLNICFLPNTQLLCSQDINCWTGVVWIIVMLLSALILTAPIHCTGSFVEQVM